MKMPMIFLIIVFVVEEHSLNLLGQRQTQEGYSAHVRMSMEVFVDLGEYFFELCLNFVLKFLFEFVLKLGRLWLNFGRMGNVTYGSGGMRL